MYRRIVFCLSAMLAISGCAADYFNNYDTITLASGDANNTNRICRPSIRSTRTATTLTSKVTASAALALRSDISAFRWRRQARHPPKAAAGEAGTRAIILAICALRLTAQAGPAEGVLPKRNLAAEPDTRRTRDGVQNVSTSSSAT